MLEAFKKYKNEVETQSGCCIKYLQSDNGREFCNHKFDDFLVSQGIQRRLTVPYTPEQNGIAKRRNRTLVQIPRCILIESGLSESFWAEAVGTANYIRNRCPTRALSIEISLEKCTNRKMKLGYLRTFGSRVYVLNKSVSHS